MRGGGIVFEGVTSVAHPRDRGRDRDRLLDLTVVTVVPPVTGKPYKLTTPAQ